MYVIETALLLVLQLVVLWRVTRAARGWPLLVIGFAVHVALHAAFLWGCAVKGVPPLARFQLGTLVLWLPLAALMVGLGRGAFGRRLFLALDYGAYVAAFMPFCHALAHNGVGGSAMAGEICAMAALVLSHLVFLLVLLPRVPNAGGESPWYLGCLTAFMLFLLLCVTGTWPHSVVTGGWREWTAFAIASGVAWVVFFIMQSGMRTYLNQLDVERNLALMTGEVAARREVIDAARRQRHDHRHHRIAIAEYLLRGQTDKALAYLEQLDKSAAETPTDKLIWCENDTLNAILSGYARQAAAKGVNFEVTANVERTVDLPDVDVVAVIANLVENAIDQAGWAQTVTVALRQRERTVGMTVTNPVPDDFRLSAQGLPCAEPGVGLGSVRRVISRYDGELVYTLEDGRLVCQAMLKIGAK